MEGPPNYMAYDRTIVVFSPDGRLLQVEYARQAVKRGSTVIGVSTRDAVILGAKRTSTPLLVPQSHRKIFEIDDHAGIAWSGMLADARDLVGLARVRSQINKVTYGEPISMTTLAKHLANRQHWVTQYAGVRPYGVGILVGGVDKSGGKLFETDPSGTMMDWKAQAIGRGAEKARKILQKDYKDKMSAEDGVKLLLKALKTGEKGVTKENAEIAVIKKDRFHLLTPSEVSKYA